MGFETSQLARYLSMAQVRAKRSIEKETLEKVKSGNCLICGKSQNGKRGLCNAHYLAFDRRKKEYPNDRRAAFEEEQIREGRILPVGQLREIRNPNPFTVAG